MARAKVSPLPPGVKHGVTGVDEGCLVGQAHVLRQVNDALVRIRERTRIHEEVIPDEARERGQRMASLDCKDADIDSEEKR